MTLAGNNNNNNGYFHGHVLKVERPYYEQEQLNNELKYSKPVHRNFLTQS